MFKTIPDSKGIVMISNTIRPPLGPEREVWKRLTIKWDCSEVVGKIVLTVINNLERTKELPQHKTHIHFQLALWQFENF